MIKRFKQFEGAIMKASKSRDKAEIESVRDKVENLLKSSNKKFKQVGDDLAIIEDDKTVAEIMFRSDYIGVKKSGSKFADEFGYDEFGKVKKAISNLG